MHIKNLISFCLLATLFFIGSHAQDASSTVTLQVFGASSAWWLALLPQNDNQATVLMELQEGSSSSYVPMEANPGWGYYTLTSVSGRGFSLPLNIRLTSSSGAQIITQLNSITPNQLIDTQSQYSSSANTPSAPTAGPSAVNVTSAPSPSSAPPSDSSASVQPITDLCALTPTSEEPLKLLVPLYVYPGSAWDSLLAAAANVKIIAVINPNSGPVSTVDSSYASYMAKFAAAGIEMIGYVHTSYGGRAISDVENDVNTWVTNYPLITGIFFDEAASAATELTYYTQIYQFAMSKPGYNQVILNPGVMPDPGYLDISTSMVILEDIGANFATATFPSWVTCASDVSEKPGYKYRFTGIANTADVEAMPSILATMNAKGMGLVYVTDGPAGCCTYNSLTSYFAQEVTSVQALN